MLRNSILFVVLNVSVLIIMCAKEVNAQGVWSLEGSLVSYTVLCDLSAPRLSPQVVELAAKSEVTAVTLCKYSGTGLQQSLALMVKVQNSASNVRTLTMPFPASVTVRNSSISKSALAAFFPWEFNGQYKFTAVEFGTLTTRKGCGSPTFGTWSVLTGVTMVSGFIGNGSQWLFDAKYKITTDELMTLQKHPCDPGTIMLDGKGKIETDVRPGNAVEFLYLIPQFSGKAEIEFGDIGSFTIISVVNLPGINDPPLVLDIPDQTIGEGKSFTTIKLDDYVSDPDNTDSQITWTYTGNTKLTVSIDANHIATITVPDPGWNGSETITFTAKDPGGLSASDSAVFTVTPVNDPPVLADILDQTVVEGKALASINLDDYVTDPDNADAEMSWTYTGNTKLTVSIDANRIATITVSDPEWNGSETITFTATDPGGLSASDSAVFTVTPVNDPPVVSDILDQTVAEGKPFASISLDDYVSDPDDADDQMTWTYTGNTELAVSIDANRIATITVPDPGWNGSETITFTATDPGGLSASDSAVFTVTPVNDPPVVSDIPDQTVEEGKPFTSTNLDDYVSDPDNADAEMSWTYTGNTELTVSIDANHVATITVSDPEWNGSETITFTATDPGGLSASDSAKLTVEKVWLLEGRFVPYTSICDLPKELSPLIATIVAVTEVKFDLYSCDSLVAESQHPLGLVVRLFNSSSSTSGFTIPFPPDVIVHSDSLSIPALALHWPAPPAWTKAGSGTMEIRLNPSSAAELLYLVPLFSGEATVEFGDMGVFKVLNAQPVLSDIPDQTIEEGKPFASINLDEYVSDQDNQDSEITWSYTGNTKLAVNIDTNRVATVTIQEYGWAGSETITFTAADPSSLSASDSVKLTVTPLVFIRGDISGDGKLNSGDVIMALRIAAGLVTPTYYQLRAGDMDGDGKITSRDALIILNEIVNPQPIIPLYMGPAARANLNTVSLDEMHGVSGESITVPVKVSNSDILAGGDICIAYDSSVLKAIDVSSGSDMLLADNINEPGLIRIAFAASNRLSSKILTNVSFQVIADAASPLTFKEVNLYNPDGVLMVPRSVDSRFISWAIPPEHSALLQNFPNPFNPETWIPYQLHEGSDVVIRIYSMSGELIRELHLGYKSAGLYISRDRAAYWDGKNRFGEQVVSGVYFYSINAGNLTAVKKMTVLE